MADTFRAVIRHTPLMLGLAVGVVTGGILAVANTDVSPLNQTLIAWDAAALAYLLTVLVQTHGINAQTIIDHAADVDDGRYFVLFVSLAAVIASRTSLANSVSVCGLARNTSRRPRVISNCTPALRAPLLQMLAGLSAAS